MGHLLNPMEWIIFNYIIRVKFKFDPWRNSKLLLRLSSLPGLSGGERTFLPAHDLQLPLDTHWANQLSACPFLSALNYDNPCGLTALPTVIWPSLLRSWTHILPTPDSASLICLSLLIQDLATYTLLFSWNQTSCYSKPGKHIIALISYIISCIVTRYPFQ